MKAQTKRTLTTLTLFLVLMAVAFGCLAEDMDSNPYMPLAQKLPPPPNFAPGAGRMGETTPIPVEITENRSVLDSMQLVGRKGNYVRLRWNQAGQGQVPGQMAGGAGASTSAAAGVTTRVWQGNVGEILVVGGRSLRVMSANNGSDAISLVLPNDSKHVVWMASFDNPTTYQVAPVMTDYQYVPPLSAGTGIPNAQGQGSTSANTTSGVTQGAVSR